MNPDVPRRSWPRRVINRLEVDRATFFAIAARVWQFGTGPISMLLIASFFTDVLQGYYYTFASLMAMQALVELGLHVVIINVASHECADVELHPDGTLTGKPLALRRLAALTRFSFRWYGVVSISFVIVLGAVGFWFFQDRPAQGVEWKMPWAAYVVLTGMMVWGLSLTAILEGCNQVAVVNRFRLLQAVIGSIVVWFCIIGGAGLWTLIAAGLVRLLLDGWLVLVVYRKFFSCLWGISSGTGFSWKKEVWPLQWRMGVRSMIGYFAFSIFTPVMFHYHGAAEAGRMGMTWAALTALEAGAFAWVYTRTPLFGMLIARADYRELDRVFIRLTAISFAVLFSGGLVLCLTVAALPLVPWDLGPKLADRLLPVSSTALFVAALLAMHVPKCMGLYVRAHKQDPFLKPGIISSGAIALSVWLGGRDFGAIGAAAGYFAIGVLFNVPCWTWIWLRCRRERRCETEVVSPVAAAPAMTGRDATPDDPSES